MFASANAGKYHIALSRAKYIAAAAPAYRVLPSGKTYRPIQHINSVPAMIRDGIPAEIRITPDLFANAAFYSSQAAVGSSPPGGALRQDWRKRGCFTE